MQNLRVASAVVIRRAQPADARVVAELLHAFNLEFEAYTPGVDVLAERLGGLLAGDDLMALLAGRPAIGVAVLTFRPGIWEPGPVALLEELYVAPDRRNEGAGTALLGEAMAVAAGRGAPYLEIQVDEIDVDARRFYERHGFSNTEEGSDVPLLYYWRRVGPAPA